MQTLLRRLAALGIALAALFSLFPCQTHAVSTSASSAILMDVDSGRVLYEQNADAKMLIASTTKILTALVAIREGDLNDVVTVSREAAYTEGSSMYLKVGGEADTGDTAVWTAALLRQRCGRGHCRAHQRQPGGLCKAHECNGPGDRHGALLLRQPQRAGP